MAVTRLFGMREGKKRRGGREKGGERKKRRRNERGKEGEWHPVKLEKVVCRTELNLSATLTEMKGDFDFFSSLSFFSSPLLCSLHTVVFMHLHFIWPPLCLPFCLAVDQPFSTLFFFFVKSKGRITLGVVFAFHYKISRSPLNENGGEINVLPLSPGACKLKKKKELHAWYCVITH